MPSLARPAANIHYSISGSDHKPTVTLINGHTRSSTDFRVFTQRLVDAGFHVVALDNRDAGQSTASADYSLQDMAEDVIAIWQHEGVPSSHVLGISMGGAIAQVLTATHPDLVRSLVLVSTAPGTEDIGVPTEPWLPDEKAILEKLTPYFSSGFVERNSLLVKSMAKNIFKAVVEGQFAEKADRQRRAMATFPGLRQFPKIKRRALVIHGDQDHIIDFEVTTQFRQLLRDVRIAKFAGAGHLLLAERAEDLYQTVIDFYKDA